MEVLMNKKIVLMFGLLAVLPLAAGCATYIPVETERGTTYRLIETSCCGSPSQVELDFGTSYILAKYNQIYNPEAGKNLDPVIGLDGRTVDITLEKYNKSFEKAAEKPVYNINVGGAFTK
jgi:hypothetical protein